MTSFLPAEALEILDDQNREIYHPMFFGYLPKEEYPEYPYIAHIVAVNDRFKEVLADMGMTVMTVKAGLIATRKTASGKEQKIKIEIRSHLRRNLGGTFSPSYVWEYETHLPKWFIERDDRRYYAVGPAPSAIRYAEEFDFDMGSEEENIKAKIEVMDRYVAKLPKYEFVYFPAVKTKDRKIVMPSFVGDSNGKHFFIKPKSEKN